jgi:hypothetical protein
MYACEEVFQGHGVFFRRHELHMPATAIANLCILSAIADWQTKMEDIHAHAGLGICSSQCSLTRQIISN